VMRHEKTKILMLCFSHPVNDGRVTFREAATLRANGYRVAVMGRAGITGKIGGRRVHGVPTLAISDRYSGNMLIRFLLEPFSLIRFFFACRRFISKADVIHCHEYQSLLVALLLKRKGRQKVVYDCHEFQPELFAEMFDRSGGMVYRVVRDLFACYERWLTRRVDGVVTVNEFLVQRFVGVCANVCNLPNYPSRKIFDEPRVAVVSEDLKARLQGRKVLVFAGYLSADRGVVDLIHIMKEITKLRDDVVLLLVGGKGCEEIFVNQAKELGVEEHVIVTGAFKYDQLVAYLRLADIGVYLPPVASWRLNYSFATKVFQYCAAGLPSVLQDIPAHREMMALYDFAVTVDVRNYKECAQQISTLLDDDERCEAMGRNALNAFCSDWNAEAVEVNLIRFYNEIEQNVQSYNPAGC
jgi:glycosyltransferase involved in cell wall biosynthesis